MSTTASAQLQSLPVYPTAALQGGSSLAADYGRVVDSQAGVAQHLGGRATLGLGGAFVEIGVGLRDAGLDADLQAAGSTGIRLFGTGASTLAVGLQVGAGYLSSGADASRSRHLTLPLSVGLALRSLTVGTAGVRPWLAPRVQLSRVSFADVVVNQLGAGASAGVEVALTGFVGCHLAVDWAYVWDRRPSAVTLFGGSRLTVGASAHLRLGSRAPAG